MKKDILEHIRNEKDISRYKIEVLAKRSSNKKYKHRLLAIEREFLEYPFEKIDFKNIDEVRKAISLFKTARTQFRDIYHNNNDERDLPANIRDVNLLTFKVDFYKRKYEYLLDKKLKKVNIFEDPFFKGLVTKAGSKGLSEVVGPDSVIRLEGAFISKKRARVQILIYCLARFIYHKIEKISKNLKEEKIKVSSLKKITKEIDDLFLTAKETMFRYYNDGIKEVPLLTNGTLGDNRYLASIYPISNILDSDEESPCFRRILDVGDGFFNKETGLPIMKKFVKRGFSAVTNIKRTGNEAIDILYADIWTNSGVCLNEIVVKSFYNLYLNNEYYKAIPTKPIWEIINVCKDNKVLQDELMQMMGIKRDDISSGLDILNDDLISIINNSNGRGVGISKEYSQILIPSTRSEAGHIKDSLNYIDLLITEIKDEYNKAVSDLDLNTDN